MHSHSHIAELAFAQVSPKDKILNLVPGVFPESGTSGDSFFESPFLFFGLLADPFGVAVTLVFFPLRRRLEFGFH